MVDVVITGTIGYDDIETPFGKRKDLLGGTATYASIACSFFAKPGVVSIVGADFSGGDQERLEKRGISLSGIEKKGKTFRWSGKYKFDMNAAETVDTQLNALLEFNPTLPEEYTNAKYIFIGNTDPDIQLKVIAQVKQPKLIALDTMNLWITTKKEKLLQAIAKTHVLLMNDGEARQLFNTTNLTICAREALKLGPQYVIIKKGEHGALLFTKEGKHFNAPGYPLEIIKDPTGCGDSFAGGFMGYIAKKKEVTEINIRRAIIYGSTIASFNAEEFSCERIEKLTTAEIEQRYQEMKEIREF